MRVGDKEKPGPISRPGLGLPREDPLSILHPDEAFRIYLLFAFWLEEGNGFCAFEGDLDCGFDQFSVFGDDLFGGA